jgi:hypothetical protein
MTVYLPRAKKYISAAILLCVLCSGLFAQGNNFKLGPVLFNMTGKLSIGYCDNISTSASHPQSDVIISPGLMLDGNWEITRFNTLNFNFGLEYHKYLNHSELDSSNNFIEILPDSEIQLQFFIRKFTVTFLDEIHFSNDPTDSVSVNASDSSLNYDVLAYSRLMNRAAVIVNWDITSTVNTELSFSRYDIVPLKSEFDSTRRTTDTLRAALYKQLSEKLRVGVNVSKYWTHYKVPYQNDSSGNSWGLMMNWQVTDKVGLSSGVDWINTDFDVTSGRNKDTSDYSSVEYRVSVNHTLNSVYLHSLSYSRGSDYGFVSNLTLSNTWEYTFLYKGIRDIDVAGGISYGTRRDTGGVAPEHSKNEFYRLTATHQYNARLKFEVGISHGRKNSDLSDRDYRVNRLWMTAYYDF